VIIFLPLIPVSAMFSEALFSAFINNFFICIVNVIFHLHELINICTGDIVL